MSLETSRPKHPLNARRAVARSAAQIRKPHASARFPDEATPASLAADTRTRILRAAERLFAEHGFDAVSMRDITALAQVNLASVNYHFGSKQQLLAEVVSGRANLLVKERLRLLAAAPRDRQGRPKLEGVVEAFLRPALEMSREPGGADHMRLRARLSVERIGVSKSQFEQTFDASNEAFVDALAQALPDRPRREIYFGFHCLLGVMNYTMANSGRIQHLSGGLCDPSDVGATLARAVPFVAHGLRALRGR